MDQILDAGFWRLIFKGIYPYFIQHQGYCFQDFQPFQLHI